jgi:phosphoglucomutase/phosphomannomutase
LVLLTDPDGDRMGCAAPCTLAPGSPWAVLNGNQLGALLTDYVLERRQAAGTLSPQHYVVKTLVTTELIRRIADRYGIRTCGDLHVGFKWIGGAIDQEGPEQFVLGCEESHGYLVGDYVRDKDGVVACLLMAELAGRLKAQGQSVHEKLDALFRQYGPHSERLITIQLEGAQGMVQMQRIMQQLREDPPTELGGTAVSGVLDYRHQRVLRDGMTGPLAGPRGDMVVLELAPPGNYLAVRPSGTEPKVKIYLFAYTPPGALSGDQVCRDEHGAWLDRVERDMRAWTRTT